MINATKERYLHQFSASIYASKHDIPARQVYYTPFPQTFSFVQEGNGPVFFGDKDPWVAPNTIRDLCNTKKMRYRIIEGGNHSLTKFLINRIGQVIDRFEPDAGTDIVRQAVEMELSSKSLQY